MWTHPLSLVLVHEDRLLDKDEDIYHPAKTRGGEGTGPVVLSRSYVLCGSTTGTVITTVCLRGMLTTPGHVKLTF